jgi:hypothetical protein
VPFEQNNFYKCYFGHLKKNKTTVLISENKFCPVVRQKGKRKLVDA